MAEATERKAAEKEAKRKQRKEDLAAKETEESGFIVGSKI